MEWSIYVLAIVCIGILFLVSWMISWLGAQTFGRAYWIVVAPGVATHELAHWLACMVTFTKVSEVVLFSREGGHVTHEKRNFLINAFIGTAPFFSGMFLLVILGQLLLAGGLQNVHITSGPWEVLKASLSGVYHYIWENGGWSDWRFYLYLYCSFTLLSTLAPSGQDLANSAIGLVILFLLMVGAVMLRTYLDLSWWTENWVVDMIAEGMIQFAGWGIMALALSLLIILPIYIVKRAIL